MKNIIHSIGVWLTCLLLRHFHTSPKVQRLGDELRLLRIHELNHFILQQDREYQQREKVRKWKQEARDAANDHPSLRY